MVAYKVYEAHANKIFGFMLLYTKRKEIQEKRKKKTKFHVKNLQLLTILKKKLTKTVGDKDRPVTLNKV